MSLGVQVLEWIPGALDYVLQSRPKYLKTLSANRSVLETLSYEIPDLHVTYRRYCDLGTQQRLLADPVRGAREMASMVLLNLGGARQFIGACESLNETGLWDSADAYNLFTAEYARVMRGEGMATVAYNFSTGTPPGYYTGDGNLHPDEFREGLVQYWAHYFDGLRESDILGLHEYSFPTMQTAATWLCLRYRRLMAILPEDCRKPILITETGIDGGVAGQPIESAGWRSVCSEEQYLQQLQWYASELEKDSYIMGAHIYHCGSADPRWDSFDVRGCDQIAAYIRDQRRETVMTEQFEFRFGFDALYQLRSDEIGKPTSRQMDIPGLFSVQFSEHGVLVYNPASNQSQFFRASAP